METETLHRLYDEKNWPIILREIDHKLLNAKEFEDYTQLVWMFENLDFDFREKHAQIYFLKMWKTAFKAGKIKLAKLYAENALDYLISLKRVPAFLKLKSELIEEGVFKTHKKFQVLDVIIGKKGVSAEDMSLCEAHPEMWKNSKNILKSYLLADGDWTHEQWKLAYEYVLKFYYDKDLFLSLADKAQQLKKINHKKNILQFLAAKKVDIKSFEEIPKRKVESHKSDLNMDYDKLAMDVMSGLIEPSLSEQKRIIISIQDLSKEELLEKGSDMIVAFGLLGMDKVVVHLCERMLPILSQVKQRASVRFMMAQALYNNSEFYKVIDLVDDITGTEPLVDEEMLAFNYLKAESFLKLKKYKHAKELFLIIKKNNPHYRLVGERLRHLEEIK